MPLFRRAREAAPLDCTAYPHILDAVLAAADFDALLALRTTSMAMFKRVDSILFKHVALEYSLVALVARTPYPPHRHLPILLPLPKEVDAGDYMTRLDRWVKVMPLMRVVDLHGVSSTPFRCDKDLLRIYMAIREKTPGLKLVRDIRCGGVYECPIDGDEWHTYMWRRFPPGDVDFVSSKVTFTQQTERIVLHMACTRGPDMVGPNMHSWIDFMKAWPRRERVHALREIVLVLHDKAWMDATGWPIPLDPPKRRTWRLVFGLHQALSCMGDGRLTFVGWDMLDEEDVARMGFKHGETIPDGDAPVAVRAILHDIEAEFDGGGNEYFDDPYLYGPWQERITSLRMDEWVQTYAVPDLDPDLVRTCPPLLPPSTLLPHLNSLELPQNRRPTWGSIFKETIKGECCCVNTCVTHAHDSLHWAIPDARLSAMAC